MKFPESAPLTEEERENFERVRELLLNGGWFRGSFWQNRDDGSRSYDIEISVNGEVRVIRSDRPLPFEYLPRQPNPEVF